jgi:hypothetical protein
MHYKLLLLLLLSRQLEHSQHHFNTNVNIAWSKLGIFYVHDQYQKLAIQKWVTLCGGDGATDLYDRN